MAEIYLMAYGLWRCKKLWELGMGMGTEKIGKFICKPKHLANSYKFM